MHLKWNNLGTNNKKILQIYRQNAFMSYILLLYQFKTAKLSRNGMRLVENLINYSLSHPNQQRAFLKL